MFALPLWLTMQYVGQDRLISIISKARVLVRTLLFQRKNIYIIGNQSVTRNGETFVQQPFRHHSFVTKLSERVVSL